MKKCKHCSIELPEKYQGLQCQTCRNGLGRYNMNRLDMISMHESQNKQCALCSKPVELFSRRKNDSGFIDHCHETDKVRAILCLPCNSTLGYIEGNNISLDRLKEYVNRFI